MMRATKEQRLRMVKECDLKLGSLTSAKLVGSDWEKWPIYLVQEGEDSTLLVIIITVDSVLIRGKKGEKASWLLGILQKRRLESFKSLCLEVAESRWCTILDVGVEVILVKCEYMLGGFISESADYNMDGKYMVWVRG